MRTIICLGTYLCWMLCTPAAADELRPLAFFTGAASSVESRSYRLIGDRETWAKVWLEHQGRTAQEAFDRRLPTFNVDFDRCTLVAIFQGEGSNSRALSIERITDDDEQIVVRFDVWTYQSSGGADRSTAYGFLLLPKADKPIVLEENTQGLKDRPAQWTHRATLDAENPVVRPQQRPRQPRPTPPPPIQPPR